MDGEPSADGNIAPIAAKERLDEIVQSIPSVPRLMLRIETSLRLLLDGAECAEDVGVDIWQFAIESSRLYQVGVTVNECRWLVAKRLLKHGTETTTDLADQRTFQSMTNLAFPSGTCFVLTDEGVAIARTIIQTDCRARRTRVRPAVSRSPLDFGLGESASAPLTPTWDSDRQQLRVGRAIVKQFKVPAGDQELVLAAFQEESWRSRIDNPLPPRRGRDSKRGLRDAINCLNRNQKKRLLHFHADRTGVSWTYTKHKHLLLSGSKGRTR
jgi:hypothetical protein